MPIEMMERHFHGFHSCTTHDDGSPGYMDPSCQGKGPFEYCHVHHVEWVNKPGTPIETIWGCVHKISTTSRLGEAWQHAEAKHALNIISRIAQGQGYNVDIVLHKPLTDEQKAHLAQRAAAYQASGGSL